MICPFSSQEHSVSQAKTQHQNWQTFLFPLLITQWRNNSLPRQHGKLQSIAVPLLDNTQRDPFLQQPDIWDVPPLTCFLQSSRGYLRRP